MAKPNDPDGPLHKWGEPEGVEDYMKKTPGQKKNKTIKVGEDTVHADDTHYALVKKRKVIATGTKEEMLNMHQEKGGRVWVSTKEVGEIVEMKSFGEFEEALSKLGPDRGGSFKIAGKKVETKKTDKGWHSSVDGKSLGHHPTQKAAMGAASKHIYVGSKKKVSEAKYSVDVDGLPRFYMDADSPAEIKKKLRSLLRKASSIDAVERSNDAKIKTDLRQRLKGADTDKRHVDEKLDPSKHDAGDYIKDFRDSDAPQFKGKSDKKKQRMAIAAYLSARREKAMDEGVDRANSEGRGKGYTFSHEKSAKGYRAHLKNPQGKTSYLGSQSYKKKEHAEGEAKAYHKAYFGHPSIKANDRGATNAVHKYRQDHKAHHAEGYMSKDNKKETTDAEVKKKQDFLDRLRGKPPVKAEGYGNPFKAAARSAKYKELSHEYEREKQVRKQKAQKSASQNKSFSNVRSRMEDVEQVDELKKSTYGSYIKKASKDAASQRSSSVVYGKAADKEAPHSQGQKTMRRHELSSFQKSQRRQKGIERATDRLTREEVELHENRMKAAKELQAYAKKSGGIDKDDFLMAGQLVKDNKMRDLKKFLKSLDTDPRDGVIQILRRNGLKESFMDVDEGMVNAVSTARRMAGNMTGAAKKIDKMRPKKQGGDFSDNPRVKKKLQKYNEGMESWKQFLESSCGGGHKRVKKEEGELSPAQKKHMDQDKDGDIDGKDLAHLRKKKKS